MPKLAAMTVVTLLVAAAMVVAPSAGLVSTSTPPPTWPGPVDVVQYLLRGTYPPACQTKQGMSQQQCNQLNMFWSRTDKPCFEPFAELFSDDPVTRYIRGVLGPWASWVSGSCPTPCAVAAKRKGVNPGAYCKAQRGSPPASFRDAGCKIASSSSSPPAAPRCDTKSN